MWLAKKRAEIDMSVQAIKLSDSGEWRHRDGALRHDTGAFFSIEGVTAISALDALNGIEQPIINQPEVGILGFIVTEADHGGFDWLMQAKAEPGNVHAVQLAPSVQATYSNYTRKHGGAATNYLRYFLGEEANLLSDGLHSEQGTRFLHKFNRNAISLAPERLPYRNSNYCWFSAKEVREMLLVDYAINTDARSVIVTAPWRLLADDGKRPFSHAAAEGWPALTPSYSAPAAPDVVARLEADLEAERTRIQVETRFVAIDRLRDWHLADGSIAQADGGGAFRVEYFDVETPIREKTHWDQPLVRSAAKDEVMLVAQERGGVLRFLLRFSHEICLTGGVEIGPSYKAESLLPHPKWLQTLARDHSYKERICAEQSDEGGRFMDSRCVYRVVEIADDVAVPEEPGAHWVTLGELEAIAHTPRLTTNELRSVISLLLGFA